MRNVLIASMATAALMAAACTQTRDIQREAAVGVVLGAAVGAAITSDNEPSTCSFEIAPAE